jgi:hypothetical protein
MRTAVPITIVGAALTGRAAGKIRAVVIRADAGQGAIAEKRSEVFKVTRAVMHPALNSQNLGGIRKKAPLGIVSFKPTCDKIEMMVSKPRTTIRNFRPLVECPDNSTLVHNKAGKTR